MRVLWHETVESTNELALAAVASGTARDGDLFVAREQTAGRGRRGKRWLGAAGEGLYASLVHRPEPPALEPQAVTMAAGVAVLATLEELGAEGLRLDWPNDVCAGPAKLAGILTESRGFDPSRPAYVVGVGINVLQRSFPDELEAEREVTSLARLGVDVTPGELAERLHPALLAWLVRAREEPAAVDAAYLEALRLGEGTIRLTSTEGALEGRLEGLSAASGARIRRAGAEPRTIPLVRIHSLERADAAGPAGAPGSL